MKIDRSKFRKRKYNRWYADAVKGEWIFGGVLRNNGACFFVPVEKRDKETAFYN